MYCFFFRSTVRYLNANTNFFRRALRIFYRDIEVPIFIKETCTQQFKLRFLAASLSIFLYEPRIGERRLGDLFAYSTETSKYRSSLKRPVPNNSNSGFWRPRFLFSCTSQE